MKLQAKLTSVLLALASFGSMALADDQLDRNLGVAPEGVLVKVDQAADQVTVYSVAKLDDRIKSENLSADEQAAVIASTIENAEANLTPVAASVGGSELDRDSSTQAWGLRYYGWGWRGPAYYNYYYTPYYRPYYSNFYYGSYGYSYGWRGYYGNSYYYWYY